MTGTGLLSRLTRAPATVAYLGNSVTAQRHGYSEHLHALLCRATGRDHCAVNAGFGGVGVIGSVCTMDDRVIRHRPDLCFVECFTGDVGVGLHRHTGAALEGVLRKLHAAAARPCILLLPREGAASPAAHAIADIYYRVAAHHAAQVVDLRKNWDDLGPLLRDGVHTSERGAVTFAEKVLAAVSHLCFEHSGRPADPMYQADFSGAGTLPAEALPGIKGRPGLFRLQLRYRALSPGERLVLTLPGHAIVGLLVIVGPLTGAVVLNGEHHELRDRWSHYERLHAHVLGREVPAGTPLSIEPLGDADGTELRLVALLTRRTELRSAPPPIGYNEP